MVYEALYIKSSFHSLIVKYHLTQEENSTHFGCLLLLNPQKASVFNSVRMVEFLFQHYHVTTSFNVPYGTDIKLGHKTLLETKFYSPAVTILLNSPVEAYISAPLLYKSAFVKC